MRFLCSSREMRHNSCAIRSPINRHWEALENYAGHFLSVKTHVAAPWAAVKSTVTNCEAPVTSGRVSQEANPGRLHVGSVSGRSGVQVHPAGGLTATPTVSGPSELPASPQDLLPSLDPWTGEALSGGAKQGPGSLGGEPVLMGLCSHGASSTARPLPLCPEGAALSSQCPNAGAPGPNPPQPVPHPWS